MGIKINNEEYLNYEEQVLKNKKDIKELFENVGIGIEKIELTGREGLVDQYTITLNNGETTKYYITNGKDGTNGKNGVDGKDGIDGQTGPQGATGATGPKGAQGATGPKGDTGATGPKGNTGAVGPEGAQGATGPKGDKGPKGDTGAVGPVGPKGDTGAQGATGPKGNTGAQGPEGAQGATGPKGDTGAQGATGAMGPKGPQGATGPKGDTGATGPKGDTGAQGPKGEKGDTGPRGDTGPTGPTGAQGPKGDKGDRLVRINIGNIPDKQQDEISTLVFIGFYDLINSEFEKIGLDLETLELNWGTLIKGTKARQIWGSLRGCLARGFCFGCFYELGGGNIIPPNIGGVSLGYVYPTGSGAVSTLIFKNETELKAVLAGSTMILDASAII